MALIPRNPPTLLLLATVLLTLQGMSGVFVYVDTKIEGLAPCMTQSAFWFRGNSRIYSLVNFGGIVTGYKSCTAKHFYYVIYTSEET